MVDVGVRLETEQKKKKPKKNKKIGRTRKGSAKRSMRWHSECV